MWRFAAIAFCCLCLATISRGQRIWTSSGNICVWAPNGDSKQLTEKQLTTSGHDSEPVFSPDGEWIVFVRTIPGKQISTGSGEANVTELWQMRRDGKDQTILVRSRESHKMETLLAGFSKPQFSSNGKLVYFLSEAWTTSGALHAVDTTNGKEHFVCAAADFEIVPSGEYRDDLLVQQHRYFIGGGSYDWFWLLKPDGKEVGPVGEDTENFKAIYIKE